MNSFNFKLEQYKILVKFRLSLNKIRNRLTNVPGVLDYSSSSSKKFSLIF